MFSVCSSLQLEHGSKGRWDQQEKGEGSGMALPRVGRSSQVKYVSGCVGGALSCREEEFADTLLRLGLRES